MPPMIASRLAKKACVLAAAGMAAIITVQRLFALLAVQTVLNVLVKKNISIKKTVHGKNHPAFCFRIFQVSCLTAFFMVIPAFGQTFTISSSNPAVAGSTLSASSTGQIIYPFTVAASGSGASMTQLTFTLTGTYTASDITKIYVKFNNSSSGFASAWSVSPDLTSIASSGNLNTISLTGNPYFNSGTTGYLWIVADISSSAAGRTMTVSALTCSNMTFSAGSCSGTAYASGQFTLGSGSGSGNKRYSVATGNWNSTSTWSTTSGGSSGAAVPVSGDTVVIEGSGRTVTLNANMASTIGSLTISSGAAFATTSSYTVAATTITVNGTYTHGSTGTVTATTLTVNSGGTFTNSSTGTITATTLTVNNSGTYTHAINGGTIPTATWGASSNCTITGLTSTAPAMTSGATFGNLTYNCTSMSSGLNLNSGNTSFSVAGTFTLTSTGANTLSQNFTPLSVATFSMNLLSAVEKGHAE